MGLFGFGKKKEKEIKVESPSIRSSNDNINAVNYFSAKDIVKIRPSKKICRMNNIDFYIQFCELGAKGNRHWITMHVVELQNEEIGTLTIGWNCADSSPSYAVNYFSNTYRPGSIKEDYGMYTLKLSSPSFSFPDAKVAYGYAEKTTKEYVTFTNIADNKSYDISVKTLNDRISKDKDLLLGYPSFVKVALLENKKTSAYILNYYSSETLNTLEYTCKDDGEALCMDMDTYEQYNIPLRYIPNDVVEFDLLTGTYAESEDFKSIDPSGRIYALHKVKEDNADTEETITTYGGFDSVKKVHIIHFNQSGNVTTQEIKESTVRKMDAGINVGTKICLKMDWDDAACQVLTDICIK